MIQVIYGEKGSGKTKQLVDKANASTVDAKGSIIYIDKNSNRLHDLNRYIRLVDAGHYEICCQKGLISFIKGMLAVDFDVEKIFIDGMAKIVSADTDAMEEVYAGLEKIAADFNLEIVVTASCAKENLPEFIAKFVA